MYALYLQYKTKYEELEIAHKKLAKDYMLLMDEYQKLKRIKETNK